MKDMNTFYVIPKYKNYCINRLGEVFDVSNNKKMEPIKNSEKIRYVIIDNVKIEIARLVLLRFCGDDDGKFDIVYKYSKKEYDMDSVSYRVFQKDIVDDFIIIINDIEFKQYRNSEYYFSKKGLVYNTNKNQFGSVFINKKGYSAFALTSIHRATYEVWKGAIPEDYTINHIDGVKWNNGIDNLEAITNAENIRHSFENELQPSVHWKEKDVYLLCSLLGKNVPFEDISKTFECYTDREKFLLRKLIYRLRYDYAWKDISSQFNIENYDYVNDYAHRSISTEMAHTICKLLEDGLGNIDISNRLNVKAAIVGEIRNGVTYKNISSEYKIPSLQNNPMTYKSMSRKLNESDVHQICSRLAKGELCTPIAEEYNVAVGTITEIKNKKTWTNISSQYTLPDNDKNFITEEAVHEVCKLLEKGLNNTDILKLHNIGLPTLCNIRNGKYFKNISSSYNIPSKYNNSIEYSPATKKLKESDVHEICKRILLGESSKLIGNDIGISRASVDDIKAKRTWKQIASQYF